MAPIHPIDFLFSMVETTIDGECSFCDEPITAEHDFYSVVTSIPGKKVVMANHVSCFEQLAWSMMNFVFSKQGQLEAIPVN